MGIPLKLFTRITSVQSKLAGIGHETIEYVILLQAISDTFLDENR